MISGFDNQAGMVHELHGLGWMWLITPTGAGGCNHALGALLERIAKQPDH